MELLLTVVEDVPLCGVVDESDVDFVVDEVGVLEEPEMELERAVLEIEVEVGRIELGIREPEETRLEIAVDKLEDGALVVVNNVDDGTPVDVPLLAFAFRS